MERTLTQEERIRRAEEIYLKRRNRNNDVELKRVERTLKTERPTIKSLRLFKRMALQIVICLLLYCIFYLIYDTNYSFSAVTLNKTEEILNYDINFENIYKYINEKVISTFTSKKDSVENNENSLEENKEIQNDENKEQVPQEEQEENKEKQDEENKIEEKENTEENELKNKYSLQLPVNGGYISSEFGEREATTEKVSTNHKGIDIAVAIGTEIFAAMSGKVIVSTTSATYGKYIIIEEGNLKTVYAHCNELLVSEGQQVTKGEVIAKSGQTGNTTGPHLHFEVRTDDTPINPRQILDF